MFQTHSRTQDWKRIEKMGDQLKNWVIITLWKIKFAMLWNLITIYLSIVFRFGHGPLIGWTLVIEFVEFLELDDFFKYLKYCWNSFEIECTWVFHLYIFLKKKSVVPFFTLVSSSFKATLWVENNIMFSFTSTK